MVYKPARIDFTDAQIRKAVQGKPVRIAANQIGKGSKVVLLHPVQHRVVSKAGMAGRGCTVELSPGEILSTVESDMDGTGFFGDIWKGLKSGYNWVKKNVIDTDIYQKTIKPLVKQGVSTLSGMVPAEYRPISDALVGEIGKQTGAFGVPPVTRRRVKRSDNVLMNGGSFRLN